MEKFDFIVIGSGIGGMSVSAILAKAGKKVLLLEQHYVAGGYTHSFKRKGYVWDAGLHYIGKVNDENGLIRKSYNYISDGQLKWTALDDVYDRAVFGHEEFEFVKGRSAQKANLKKYFPAPKDQVSIDKYFELLDKVDNLGNSYYIEKIMPSFISKLFGSFLQKKLLYYSDQTTLAVLKSITDNTKLIGVLTAQYGDYGLPPAQSSFYMHAMVANHYMEGAGYPVGGAAALAKNIIPVIEKNGGQLITQAKVKEIIVENNVAKGVLLEDGTTHYAKYIISDAGIINTFTNLLPTDIQEKKQLKDKLKNLKPAFAHLSLNIGCKVSSESLQLPKCNYWIFPPEYDHDKNQAAFDNLDAPLPVIFVSFPSAKNPDWDKEHPNTCTIEIVALVQFDWFSKWEKSEAMHQEQDYLDLKEKLSQKLLAMLFNVLPRLEDKIDYYELSTPLSTKKFMNYSKGEIYGIESSPERFRHPFMRPQTPIQNLYLTGQDVFITSVSGGLMGGILTASNILYKNIFSKIKKE